MDFAAISEHFVLLVVVGCLLIGYIIKHATFLKWIPNNDIPVLLALVGAVLNIVVSGLSIESVIYGAVMGLASTGMHQAFTQWVDNNNNSVTE